MKGIGIMIRLQGKGSLNKLGLSILASSRIIN